MEDVEEFQENNSDIVEDEEDGEYEDGVDWSLPLAGERYVAVGREKNKICQYCQKGIVDSSHLKRHLMVDTKERTHQCPHYCDQAFGQQTK